MQTQNLSWESLGLSKPVLDLIAKAGYERPTPIQAEAIPVALQGKDIIASARTGSGKTAGFCLPMIEALKGRRGTYGLILCPTREIALQIQRSIEEFGAPLEISSIVLIGGTDMKTDITALKQGPHIIVGTPGRICDHLERGNLWLEFVETLVLDEADRMLDMGFARELSLIVEHLPKTRQTLLFSATFAPSVEKLAKKILRSPERIAIGSSETVSETVEHEIWWMNPMAKKRELMRLLRGEGTFIVFVRTKDEATRLWRSIHAAGIHDSTYISSNKSQAHREEALNGFRAGTYRVLVATDVAGRGIHVDAVGCVVNFDLPVEPEDYIHRVGRTGRQDARGRAVSFVTAEDGAQVALIEKLLGRKIRETVLSDFDSNSSDRGNNRRGGAGRGRRPRRGGGDRISSRVPQPGRYESQPRGEDRPPRREHRSRDDEFPRGEREGASYPRERHFDDEGPRRPEPRRSSGRREPSRSRRPERQRSSAPRSRDRQGARGRDRGPVFPSDVASSYSPNDNSILGGRSREWDRMHADSPNHHGIPRDVDENDSIGNVAPSQHRRPQPRQRERYDEPRSPRHPDRSPSRRHAAPDREMNRNRDRDQDRDQDRNRNQDRNRDRGHDREPGRDREPTRSRSMSQDRSPRGERPRAAHPRGEGRPHRESSERPANRSEHGQRSPRDHRREDRPSRGAERRRQDLGGKTFPRHSRFWDDGDGVDYLSDLEDEKRGQEGGSEDIDLSVMHDNADDSDRTPRSDRLYYFDRHGDRSRGGRSRSRGPRRGGGGSGGGGSRPPKRKRD